MTHDELLIEINRRLDVALYNGDPQIAHALRAVVELHSGRGINNRCVSCSHGNSCETIQVIEKELG